LERQECFIEPDRPITTRARADPGGVEPSLTLAEN
jgi:hypothetical protein